MKRLLPIVLLVMLAATAWAGFGDMMSAPTTNVVVDPDGGSSSVLDQPQPDTLAYDNLVSTGAYRWSGAANQWCAVRFTPLSQFEVRSVYFRVSNTYAIAGQKVTIRAVEAIAGNDSVPNFASVIAQIDSVPIPTTTSAWMDTSFATPFTRTAYQDYWVIVGPFRQGAVAAGAGPWMLFDQDVNGNRRSWGITGTTVWNTAGYTNNNYDWRFRVGGAYAGPFTELAPTMNWWASNKFFHVPGSASDIVSTSLVNYGNTAATNYTVTWYCKNTATGDTVWTSTANGTNIAARGGTATISSPTAMPYTTVGDYLVSAVVFSAGEGYTSNNTVLMENHVYDPAANNWFKFDDGVYESNMLYNAGQGFITRFDLDSWPATVDSIMINGGSGTCDAYLYADVAGAPGATPLWSQAGIVLTAGVPTYLDVTNPLLSSGSFWLGLINVSGLSVPVDNSPPSAAQNTQMRIRRTGTTASWVLDLGNDHPVRPLVKTPSNWSVSVGPNGTGAAFVGSDVWYNLTVSNAGLNSDTYNLSTTGAAWNTTIWNSARTDQITSTGVVASTGTFTFSVRSQIPVGAANGAADVATIIASSVGNPGTTGSATVTTTAQAPFALPFNETFEGGVFPPASWIISNPDNATTWTSFTYGGNTSAKFDFYNYATIGARDYLITPAINFTGAAEATISFDHSYAPYSPTDTDSLKVEMSEDNGATWTSVLFYQGGVTLMTSAAPETGTHLPDQWRANSLAVPAGAMGQNDIRFRFHTINSYGNMLYVDNVRIVVPTTGPVYSSAGSLNLGTALVGSPSTATLAINNFGGAALNITGVNFTGDFSGSTAPFSVGVGASVNYTVTFSPTAAGAANGSVVFTHNGTTSPSTVTLSGTGIGYIAASSGGPDSYGYTWTSDRAAGGPTWAWEDVTGATLISTSGNQDDDNWLVSLPTGFDFDWYGQPVTNFTVSSNGWLSFTSTLQTATLAGNPTVLGAALPNAYVGVYNDDLIYGNGTTAFGGVYAEVVGSAPTRQYVVTWVDMDQFDVQAGTRVTFQAVLNEGSYVLECRYLTSSFGDAAYNYGASSTFGIEGWNGLSTLLVSANSGSSAVVGTHSIIRYTPPAIVGGPTLSITSNGTDAVLSWSSISASAVYAVYASTTPSVSSSWSIIAQTSNLTYTDVGAIATGAKYYLVAGMDPSDSQSAPREIGRATLSDHTPITVIGHTSTSKK